MRATLLALAFLCAPPVACTGAPIDNPTPEELAPRTRVFVLGMLHGDHTASERYPLDLVADIVRRFAPDVVLTEIPPDRYPVARAEFDATGAIEEPRVRRFPEYVDVLFPLSRELGFEIVPCAGWTEELADARRALLAEWQTTRPADTAAVEAGYSSIAEELDAAGYAPDDPAVIHTRFYDIVVKRGLEPYDRLFNDDLGPGGWTNINHAHYALIEAALDARKGRGERVLITFGAWHKHWILGQLLERDDVEVLEFSTVLPEG